jgi:hypothetical protein
MRIARVALIVALSLSPCSVRAQGLPPPIGRAIVIDSAPILLLPEPGRTPMRVAARGSALTLLKEDNGWCQVQFQDPQFGLRTGWVQSRFVQVELDALRPRDLSVPTAVAAPARPSAPVVPVRPAAPPSAAQAPAPAGGQAPIPRDYVPPEPSARGVPNKVFLDGNFLSFHPRQKALSLIAARPLFSETASWTVNYPALPALHTGAVSVAFVMGHQFGFGFRVLLPRYTEFAALTARVPHPTLFNRFGSDVGVSGELERKDVMLDLSASYVVNQPRWRAIVSAGPSYFHTAVDLVNRVVYAQAVSLTGTNLITVTGATTTHETASTWGLNVGGDIAVFPWQHVGFGGGTLFNKGTIQIDDPFTLTSQDLDMSSVTLLVGPRFRF